MHKARPYPCDIMKIVLSDKCMRRAAVANTLAHKARHTCWPQQRDLWWAYLALVVMVIRLGF